MGSKRKSDVVISGFRVMRFSGLCIGGSLFCFFTSPNLLAVNKVFGGMYSSLSIGMDAGILLMPARGFCL